jgi:YVTN family beta-propeller protein
VSTRREFIERSGGFALAAATAKPHRRRLRPHSEPPQTTGTAYVVCSETNAVAVLDLPTGRIVQYVTVGDAPSHIALDRRLGRAYVSNYGSNTISVIDTARLEVISSFDTSNGPAALAFDSGRQVLYTCHILAGTVTALDVDTGRIVGSAIVGSRPTDIALDPFAERAYVVNSASGTLSYVNVKGTKLVADTVAADRAAATIALARDYKSAYVCNSNAGTISVFDLQARRAVSKIVGLHQPEGIAIANDAAHIFVAEAGANAIATVDTRSGAVLTRMRSAMSPSIVRANVANDRLLALDFEGDSLTVFDSNRQTSLSTIGGFGKPSDVAVDG